MSIKVLRLTAPTCHGPQLKTTLDRSEIGVGSEDDSWTVLQGSHEGRPLLVRFREFPSEFPRLEFPTRLNVFWSMAEPDGNGLASQAEAERLAQFEYRLVSAMESDRQSVLAVILTTAGKREFVVQSRDASEFLRRMNDMPQENSRYPIEIHKCDDESWEYVNSVITV